MTQTVDQTGPDAYERYGGDWEEIEEARQIARTALESLKS